VEFRILGPLQVLDAGRELPLGSPKERALLAVLLLNAGEVVSRERLIDGLWGDSPPPTAGRALNVHVSQLRKTLARNGRDPISTRSPGYTLKVEREQLDAARFKQRVTDARARVAAGDVQAANSVLRQALALWKGPALAGVELESTARNETRRLDDLRLAAQMDLIDCDLALGSHEAVIGELETLVAEHPLHERLRGQYMVALYRAGRQAAALSAYQEARQTLLGEVGLEPSVALQRLERAILNHDPALEAPAGIPRPLARARPGVPRRLRDHVSFAVASAGFVIALAVAVAVVATTRHARVRVPPNTIAVISRTAGTVTRSIPVDLRPTSIAAGPKAVWVLNRGSATLSEIDPRTLKRVRTIGIGGYPSSLVVRGRTAWLADAGAGYVSAVNLNDGRVVRRNVASSHPNAPAIGAVLAAADHALWITRPWPPGLVPVAATDGRFPPPTPHRKSIPLPDTPNAAAFNGELWVTSGTSGTVSVIHLQSRQLVAHIPIGRSPVAVAVGGGAAWVATVGDDTVSRIDPAVFQVVAKIHLRAAPTALALDVTEGALWVASRDGGTVARIDTRSNRVVKTLRIGNKPIALAVALGHVWVTVDSR
jgi:YVTN family beta-propeller protein